MKLTQSFKDCYNKASIAERRNIRSAIYILVETKAIPLAKYEAFSDFFYK